MYLGAKLAETFGAETFPADINISTQWADVETRNEEAHRMAVRGITRPGLLTSSKPGTIWATTTTSRGDVKARRD